METVIVAHCKLQSTDHHIWTQSLLLQFLSLAKICIWGGDFIWQADGLGWPSSSVLISFSFLIMHWAKSSMIFHDFVSFSEYFNVLLIMLISDSTNWVVLWDRVNFPRILYGQLRWSSYWFRLIFSLCYLSFVFYRFVSSL